MLCFLTNQSPTLEKLKNLAASVQFSGVGGARQEGRNDHSLHLLLMSDLSCRHPYHQYGV